MTEEESGFVKKIKMEIKMEFFLSTSLHCPSSCNMSWEFIALFREILATICVTVFLRTDLGTGG